MASNRKADYALFGARYEGFEPKHAFFEEVSERVKAVPKHISKEGLKVYSEKEVEEKSGDIVLVNRGHAKTSWKTFKSMSYDNRHEFIMKFMNEYPGIGSTELASYFDVSRSCILNELSKLDIHPRKGGKKNFETLNCERFIKKFCTMTKVEEPIAAIKDVAKVEVKEEPVKVSISNIKLEGNIKDICEILLKFYSNEELVVEVSRK